MPAVLAPMRVMTLSGIVAQYNLTDDEFIDLIRRLAPYEKRLTTGQPGYLVADLERELAAVRVGT